jgi:cation transport ATPase
MNDIRETNRRTGKIIALLQEKVRLEPNHRRLFYLVFAVLWLSGALWLVAEWRKQADLGPVRTPIQTLSMKIHGAAMLLYLAMLGTLCTHVRRGFASRANRMSGTVVIAVNLAMIISAWMLYYVTGEALREWSSLIHWSIGLAAVLLLLGHILLGRWSSGKTQDPVEKNGKTVSVR